MRFGLCGAVGIALLTSTATAYAAEQLFFRGGQWEVALSSPDSGSGTEHAFCEARTTTWAAKHLGARYELIGLDKVASSFWLHKDGWGLPAGQATQVTLSTPLSPWTDQLDVKVIDPDTLRADANYLDGIGIVSFGFGSAWNPKFVSPLNITFQGNEPQWTVPPSKPINLYQLKSAFAECRTALVALGPQLFAGTASVDAAPTSPFSPLAPSAAVAPDLSNGGKPEADDAIPAPSSMWEFSEGEEDWGKTCFVSAKAGEVTVGFMGSPGKNLLGYVDGLFEGDTPTSWMVNGQQSVLSTGSVNDYFGWHEFTDIGEDFIAQLAMGERLTVSNLGDKRVVVSLKGAAEAVPAFMACFHATK